MHRDTVNFCVVTKFVLSELYTSIVYLPLSIGQNGLCYHHLSRRPAKAVEKARARRRVRQGLPGASHSYNRRISKRRWPTIRHCCRRYDREGFRCCEFW